jgi:pyridoxine 5-phosphate synthase
MIAGGPMVRLSVNVNKVATVRNSRGGSIPSVLEAARVVVSAGAAGVTVHPRSDERHITRRDVRELRQAFATEWGPALEYNIEGDPRPDWLDLVCEVRPAQATLVPVSPGEVTSHAGWAPGEQRALLEASIARLHAGGIRVSLFVDPEPASIEWAKELGADRVELYTEPFARAFEMGSDAATRSFETYVRAAEVARAQGLGLNAGHDLDLENLVLFRTLPHLDEVSIGHAIVSRAIFVGLERVVHEYLDLLRSSRGT